ncbi:putative Pollike protein, partial [Globisporangium splendens]
MKGATNPGLLWEGWKRRIRCLLQSVQRKIKRQDDDIVLRAKHSLEVAANLYREDRSLAREATFRERLASFNELRKQVSMVHQDSAFDLHAEHSERSSSFFFRSTDASLRRVPVDSITLQSGVVSSDPGDISHGFVNHWGRVFGDETLLGEPSLPPSAESQTRLLDSINRTLSESQCAELNDPITALELAETIRHMKARSSPGLDGFTASFYQVDPDVFGEILAIVFDYQLRRGILLPSQRKSCVVLLHKKGSRSEPGNYRPIALMQVDVKILSKALAFRLRKVVHVLVHQDQAGFIPGRSLHHHVRFLKELQQHVTNEGNEGYALFLDFEKAYDRVDWRYMEAVLERMNCGGRFIEWVRLLYNCPVAQLHLNGGLHGPIRPTRGVKQGDPLSCFLFLLCIEPLGQLLRLDQSKGIRLRDDVVATGLYFADDSTVLTSSLAHLTDQLELVQVYCAGSGARLNLQKSALLPLNRRTQCPSFHQVRVITATESISYLGIEFSQCDDEARYLQKLDDVFYRSLKNWGRRARTIRGRVLLCKAVILSKLWHFTAHITVPNAFIVKWQRSLNRFVLNRKWGRDAKSIQLISTEFVLLPTGAGGLSVPSIEATLRRQRLGLIQQFAVRCLERKQHAWAVVSRQIFDRVLPKYGENCALDFLSTNPRTSPRQFQVNLLSTWWKTSWSYWSEINWPISAQDLPNPDRQSQLLCEPIWFNKNPILQVIPRGFARHSRPVGAIPEPQQSHRRRFAQEHNIRCLFDVLTDAGRWPSEGEFLTRFLPNHPDTSELSQYARWLHPLYCELTQIASQCGLEEDVLTGLPRLALFSEQFAPMGGIHGYQKPIYFPNLRRIDINKVIPNVTRSSRKHPITAHEDSDTIVQEFLEFEQAHQRSLLPVYRDFRLRLAFRLVPVGYRLSFLHKDHPERLYCPVPRCNGIETDRHLLFDCPHYGRVWLNFDQDWSQFFAAPMTWTDAILPFTRQLRQDWEHKNEAIVTLWSVISAITLHTVWTDRNAVVFRNAQPTSPQFIELRIFVTFSAHIRSLLRRANCDGTQSPSYADLQCIITQLRRSQHFGSFFNPRSNMLKIQKLHNIALVQGSQVPPHHTS